MAAEEDTYQSQLDTINTLRQLQDTGISVAKENLEILIAEKRKHKESIECNLEEIEAHLLSLGTELSFLESDQYIEEEHIRLISSEIESLKKEQADFLVLLRSKVPEFETIEYFINSFFDAGEGLSQSQVKDTWIEFNDVLPMLLTRV